MGFFVLVCIVGFETSLGGELLLIFLTRLLVPHISLLFNSSLLVLTFIINLSRLRLLNYLEVLDKLTNIIIRLLVWIMMLNIAHLLLSQLQTFYVSFIILVCAQHLPMKT